MRKLTALIAAMLLFPAAAGATAWTAGIDHLGPQATAEFALADAIAYWHADPCTTTRITFADQGNVDHVSVDARDPFGDCVFRINTHGYLAVTLRYWIGTAALRGDPWGQDAWEFYCHGWIHTIGQFLGHPDSMNPRSIMYPRFGFQRRTVIRACGTHP